MHLYLSDRRLGERLMDDLRQSCNHGWRVVVLEEEELRCRLGAGVNKVFVHRTSVVIPQGNGVGCDTTSPFAGSIHYVGN